ncbi:MAG: glutathione transferase GstA [Hyphomicrobiales bacterium]|nr:glutathione transferase GstA [Hyphomicrobiales bacterium]
MKLYYSPGACSLAPHIVLSESGAPYSIERVDLAAKKTAHGDDYLAINPKGQVPVLALDNGVKLTEGPIIVQYIADHAGDHRLMPKAGDFERYRVMEWQNYITAELHKFYSPLFNPNFDDATKNTFRGLLRRKYEWIDGKLAGKHYLTGDHFTGADAYLFTVTNWARVSKVDLSGLAHVAAFMERVAARPAVQAAMKAEGLIK